MAEFIHFIYLGAAIGFALMPFGRSRERAKWARGIFLTVAALFLIVAACRLSVDFQLWKPTEHGRRYLEYYLEGIRGFALGCLFVLFMAGQFFGKKNLKNETAG